MILFGWAGMFPPTTLAWGWYANPAYAIGVLLLKYGRRTDAQISGAISIALALTSLLTREWPSWPLNFAGPSGTMIERFGLGFYFWIGSISLAALLPYVANNAASQKS